MPTPLIESYMGVCLLLEYHPYRFPAAMLALTAISVLGLALILRALRNG